jgi:hypothetical protein
MEVARALLSTSVAATASAATIAANAGVEHFTGSNVLGMMAINPAYSLLAGAALGKAQFKGAFGYKTLLRGIEPSGFRRVRDSATLGGVVLPLAEASAKASLALGYGNGSLFMHGMADARKYGLGNILASSVLDVEGALGAAPSKAMKANLRGNVMRRLNMGVKDGQLISGMVGSESNSLISLAAGSTSEDDFIEIISKTKQGRKNLGIGTKGGKIGADLKEGRQVYSSLYQMVQRGKNKTSVKVLSWLSGKNWMESLGSLDEISMAKGARGYMINSAKNTGMAVLAKGSTLARGMSIFSALSLIQIGGAAAMWAGGQLLEGASQTLAYGMGMVMDSQRMEMANGKLAPIFMGPNAATERQRAIKASYNAKVNPSSRMYGNEAGYMHR